MDSQMDFYKEFNNWLPSILCEVFNWIIDKDEWL